MLIFYILILLAVTAFPNAYGVCNVCQLNGVACINSTSFYLCYGSTIPNYDNLYHCKNGFDCTDLNVICAQSTAGRPASCGDISLCGLCSAHRNYLHACTSRSTFRMCYGSAQPKSELGYCPAGYVCDASSNSVCVPAAQANTVTCDILNPEVNDPINPTTDVATTNTPTTSAPLTAQEVCNVEQKIGVYQIPGDITCLQYIRCYMKQGAIFGSLTECPSGTYFSEQYLQCVLTKPFNCV